MTEAAMAESFTDWLSSSSRNVLPRFNTIVREIRAQQGVVDVIATLRPRRAAKSLERIGAASHVFTPAVTRVLSLLRYRSPRTEAYLISRTGESGQAIRRIVRELIKLGFVVCNKHGSYLLSKGWILPEIDLWAFELKLSDWKRALFQASQCKAFASRVVVVFPPDRAKVLGEQLDKFRKQNVGVMLFDAPTGDCEVLIRPRKLGPPARAHYLTALSNLAKQIHAPRPTD